MKTLYISDLDGTLLNSQAELNPYTIETINTLIEKGMHFTVATARTAATVSKILAPLNLSVPVVLMNGVIRYDMKQKEYLNILYLPEKTVSFILRTAKQFHLTGFLYQIKDNSLTTYYENLTNSGMLEYYTERKVKFNKTFIQKEDLIDAASEHSIYFAMIDKMELLLPAYEIYKNLPGVSTAFYQDNYNKEGMWFLEVFSNKATKYNAVMGLRETCGYDRVICFGDNLNDLPMFKASDITCAVANAKDEVKAAATHIIQKNTEDGVARWLIDHFKKDGRAGEVDD